MNMRHFLSFQSLIFGIKFYCNTTVSWVTSAPTQFSCPTSSLIARHKRQRKGKVECIISPAYNNNVDTKSI